MTVEPKRYRKKPVQVEAIQWLGNNSLEIVEWINHNGGNARYLADSDTIYIGTLEGPLTTSLYDWIIKGVAGEFYPCKPDIFEQTYELVESWEPPYDG